MDRAFGGRTHLLTCGGQCEIFDSRFLRRIIRTPDGLIQTGLEAAEQSVHTADGNQYPGCPLVESDRQLSIVVYVEAWDTLHCVPLLCQNSCQRAAKVLGRGAFETKLFDLYVCKPALVPQMFPVGRPQRQGGHHSSIGAVDFPLAGPLRLGDIL